MAKLHPIEVSALHARRERVFLVLTGLFLGSMTMLNILGVSRFIDLSFTVFGMQIPMMLAVGVLPYPITFLCTDYISELYGRDRANWVVFVGLILNVYVVLFMWLGGSLPPTPELDIVTGLPPTDAYDYAFFRMRFLTMGAVLASMVAYMAAQFCDVYLFHFWKTLTKGRHLWLRNNGSTLVSQLVDSSAVILITWWIGGFEAILDDETSLVAQLGALILTGYLFKFCFALLDTLPFYWLTSFFSRYLEIDPYTEHTD